MLSRGLTKGDDWLEHTAREPKKLVHPVRLDDDDVADDDQIISLNTAYQFGFWRFTLPK